MARAADQTRQPLSHRPMEAFDTGRIPFDPSCGKRQEFLRALDRALRHAPNHFDDVFVHGVLDDRTNHDLWPCLQLTTLSFASPLDPVTESSPDTVCICGLPVASDQEGAQRQTARFDHSHELIGQLAVTMLADNAPTTAVWRP